MTELTPGTRLRSATSTSEVIVTMGDHGVLTCGGQPMTPVVDSQASPQPSPKEPSIDPVTDDIGETLLGKRYHAPNRSLQVLCVRPGAGTLAIDGTPLTMMKPKLLPASD